MKYTHAIWDFNGTVLDDVQTGILAVNRLLADRGLPTIPDRAAYHAVFRFPIREYYASLGFDFSVESYEALAPQWVALYLDYVKDAPLCVGARETLTDFGTRGLRQILLSATERDMLAMQVQTLGLTSYFDDMLGLGDIHAKSKVALARAWREEHPDAHAFFLGDTEHDKEAAEAMGVDCFLIAGGHQSREKLLATGAPVFDSLHELRQYLIDNELI